MQAKRITLSLLAVIFALSAAAQDDTAVWGFLTVKKAVTPRWSLLLKSEIHSRENTSTLDYWYVATGAGYRFTPWLRTDFGVLFVNSHGRASATVSDYWRPIYRTYASFTFSHRVSNVRLAWREYWGYCWMPEKTVDGVYKKGSAYHEHRSRLRADITLPHSRFTPYAFIEEWNTSTLDRMRYATGITYRLDKRQSIGLLYMYQDKHHSTNTHVLGLEYDLTL